MSSTGDPAQEADRHFMRRALELARRGWGWTAPNPMVGAVVVREGVVVGEGWHARYGEAHAEPVALAAAGDRARGATLYVTLEPCTHFGKTPPCADAVIAAGVARVVIATADPSADAGGGAAKLRAAGIRVDEGVEHDAARELNAPFFHAVGGEGPFITLKLATSLDGAIADHTRRPGWLTGPEARAEVHRLRAGHDAVAVGRGTADCDDPLLTVRDAPAPRVPPVRVVFDSGASLRTDSRLARTAHEVPVVVVARDPDPDRVAALIASGVDVVRATTLRDALAALRGRGIRSMLVEGGAGFAGALLDARLVDRLVLVQAPLILGEGALNGFARVGGVRAADAPRWRVVERRALGDDLMTVLAPEER